MADPKHTYYMEKESQFWEIKVLGKETTIRFGKVGKPGRKLAAKKHESAFKARQFAVRQVNGKIIQGFEDPNVVVPRAPMVKLLSRRSSVRLQRLHTLRRQATLASTARQFISKGGTAPRQPCVLKKSDTMLVKSSDTPETSEVKPQWRKPPKKQSTIRRQAKQTSLLTRKGTSKYGKSVHTKTTHGGLLVNTKDKAASFLSRQETVGMSSRLTRGTSLRNMLLKSKKSTMPLPVLERKRSSWDRPRSGDNDVTMPRLLTEHP